MLVLPIVVLVIFIVLWTRESLFKSDAPNDSKKSKEEQLLAAVVEYLEDEADNKSHD